MNTRQIICLVAVFGLMFLAGIPAGHAIILEMDGAPSVVDPNLVGWWKADAGVNFSSGTSISSWDNQAIFVGGTAAAPNANAYPTYLASVPSLNGQPGVYFDRVTEQDRLFSSVVPATGNNPRTMIAVFVDDEGAGGSAYTHVAHYGSDTIYGAFGIAARTSDQAPVPGSGTQPNVGNHYWGYRGSSLQKASINPTMFVSQYDGDVNSFWANGYARGSANPPGDLVTGSTHGIVLGGIQSQAPNEGFKGIIAEVIAYDTVLTTGERQQIEGYLNAKYALSIPANLSDPFFSAFTYNGDARQASDGTTDVIRLTNSGASQAGSAFTPMTMAADYSFQAGFEFQISLPGGSADPDGLGADGMAFLIHQDPRGAAALGELGGGLGFAGAGAITPALAIEIDTWHGGYFDYPTNTNTNGNHIAIDVAGMTYSVAQTGVLPRFNDGTRKYGWVDYDGVNHQMNVYLSDTNVKPGAPILSQQIYLDRIFEGQNVYVGCSAGTGGAVNTHDVYGMGMVSVPSTSAPGFTPVHVVYNDFSNVSAFTMNIAATSTPPSSVGGRLRLTDNVGSQGTSAMLTNRVSLVSDYSFQTEFDFEVSLPGGAGDGDGLGADGMTFVIHRDYRGAAVVGGGGGAMGLDGLTSFVAVEFDTWATGSYDPGAPGNSPTHIGIDTSLNGALANVAVPYFNNGGVMTARVEYNGETKLLDVYLWQAGGTMPATPTLSAAVDFGAIFGPVNDVYLGFTAGTGGAFNRHEVLSWEFHSVPEPSTLLLTGLGLLGLALVAVRRRGKRA